ncbi:MAG: hypothetical protein LBS68_03360 [Puniceicoccales bacterium]|nr:hypothetical protein [Puniceicoccales bacterium]
MTGTPSTPSSDGAGITNEGKSANENGAVEKDKIKAALKALGMEQYAIDIVIDEYIGKNGDKGCAFFLGGNFSLILPSTENAGENFEKVEIIRILANGKEILFAKNGSFNICERYGKKKASAGHSPRLTILHTDGSTTEKIYASSLCNSVTPWKCILESVLDIGSKVVIGVATAVLVKIAVLSMGWLIFAFLLLIAVSAGAKLISKYFFDGALA